VPQQRFLVFFLPLIRENQRRILSQSGEESGMALTVKRIEPLGEGRPRPVFILVTQTGGASWAYRYKVNGKERWMGLGGLYDVNIDEARERRWNARQLLKKDKVAALDKRKAERDARALAEVWRTVVDSMPADHFIPANYHLLTQLLPARCGSSQDCAVDQGLSQEENRFQHQGIWRVAEGAAISNRNPWDEKW
jgi:Arm DNA-binding domain